MKKQEMPEDYDLIPHFASLNPGKTYLTAWILRPGITDRDYSSSPGCYTKEDAVRVARARGMRPFRFVSEKNYRIEYLDEWEGTNDASGI